MNRRKWMTMSAGCFAALVCGRLETSSLSSPLDASVRDARDAFDHILLGAPDLDVGIRWVEERTGVRAMFGGNHPGAGTRNALLSLGTGHYLEIIAPDPAQANAPDTRDLKELSSPRIIQWAIHTEDIAAAKNMVEVAGIKTVGPRPGSRQRPDGKLLRWQTLGIEQTTPLVPFFIRWEAGSPHPSSDSPRLGTAKSLRFETPQPDELRRILHAVAIQADIRKSGSPRIVLVVQTPKGEIEIS
jgi:Glyoxalase-like domain